MKLVIIVITFLLGFGFSTAAEPKTPISCQVQANFSSQGSIGDELLKEIRQAKSKLFLAVFGFTNMRLAEELVNLSKQGIAVRIKMEETKTVKKRHYQVVQFLRAGGVPVQAVGGEGKNHNKFAVIDERKVITGSYNWTLRAEKNWENLLVLDSPKLAMMYEREWETIQ